MDVLPSTFRAEERLILRSARSYIGREYLCGLKDIDWDYLVRVAQEHGMLPLVYRSLSASRAEAVPKAVLAYLRHQFQLGAGSNCFLAVKLLDLLDLLDRNGIPSLPFKGPTLAASAYGDLALRPFGDLDIFVHREDASRAKELLLEEGFKVVDPPEKEQELKWLHSHYHYTLAKDGDNLVVEIHWGVAPRFLSFSMDDESWWERKTTVALLNRSVPCFSPEDQLLLLSVHGAKHLWKRLIWLCDIAEFLRSHPELDWPTLLARARELGAERMLLLGLALARQLLQAPLPEHLERRIHTERSVTRLSSLICSGLFSARSVRQTMRMPVFYLHVQERWRNKARYLIYLLSDKLRRREYSLARLRPKDD